MSVEIKTVNFGEKSLKYFSFGEGRKVMIILPGLSVKSVMESAAAIKAQYKIFRKDYTVYVLERLNNPPADYTMEDMARDTSCAIKALGLRETYIFGASQGGMLAMLIAIEYPELVKKLVLGSTTVKVNAGCSGSFEKWIDLAEQGNAEELYLSFCESIYPPDMFGKFKDVFIEFAKTATAEDLERFVIFAKAAQGFDISEKIEKISCPVLAIGVKGDAVVGEEGTKLIAEKLASKSGFELYYYDEKYGHSAFDTAEDYQKRIYYFFKD